jgi:hypothetical protein
LALTSTQGKKYGVAKMLPSISLTLPQLGFKILKESPKIRGSGWKSHEAEAMMIQPLLFKHLWHSREFISLGDKP